MCAGYSRQAHVALRCALENAVIHYYHACRGRTYDQLMMAHRRPTPRFRAMVEDLSGSDLIDDQLSILLLGSYGRLSRYVHSNIRLLTTDMSEDEIISRSPAKEWNDNASEACRALILLDLDMLATI